MLNKYFKFFSWQRLQAMLTKEFIQMRRDRLTFAMIVAIPLMQLILFGFAINTDPKYIPTAIIDWNHSIFSRTFIAGLKNTNYFDVKENVKNEIAAHELLATGRAQFVITIPSDFSRKLLRQEKPEILIEADATDPVATGAALSAVKFLTQGVFQSLYKGSLQYLQIEPKKLTAVPDNTPGGFNLVAHANYNPENINAYNIVPGLLGVVLTMTMVIITSMGVTREREKGTMEHLLSTPVRPLEVMLGKLLPFVIVGYIQVFLIIVAAIVLFHVPFHGSILLLVISALPFIAANLAIGLTFSSLANTQLQSSQMSVFFFLPSMLLSGFMFPFRGMPVWAQDVGSILPLTYFLRITRGIVLKGNGIAEIWPNLWPIMIFMVAAILIALKRYRKTLD
jgi:ABC-2 type transport system permease protein